MKEQMLLFKKGSYLYVEGDEDSGKIYIIRKGAVKLTYSNRQMKDVAKTLGDGDILGFTSALCDRPRTESAIALIDSDIVVMSKEDFLKRVLGSPSLAVRLINYFAQQLRDYDDLVFTGKSYNENQLSVSTKLLQNAKFYYKSKHIEVSFYIASILLRYYPYSIEASEAEAIIRAAKGEGFNIPSAPIANGIYRSYVDKQVIFCEDEPGDELFIIRDGKVKIVRQRRGSEIVLSVLNHGEIFGELAILSTKPRNATAISVGKSTVLPINQASLLKLVEKSPIILRRILISISQRVWFTHIRMDSATYKKQITKIYAFLRNKLMEERVSLQSTDPHLLSFGLSELKSMADVAGTADDSALDDEILADTNLRFQMGQIVVLKPKLLASKAHYYISRDNIKSAGETGAVERFVFQEEDNPAENVNELFNSVEDEEDSFYGHDNSGYGEPVGDHNNFGENIESGSSLMSEFDDFREFE